jgi:hypothetical protein
MADNKSHAALRQHMARAKASHAQTGQSLDKMEEIMAALKGAQQQPAQQPAAVPAATPGGVSPLGGMAQ